MHICRDVHHERGMECICGVQYVTSGVALCISDVVRGTNRVAKCSSPVVLREDIPDKGTLV